MGAGFFSYTSYDIGIRSHEEVIARDKTTKITNLPRVSNCAVTIELIWCKKDLHTVVSKRLTVSAVVVKSIVEINLSCSKTTLSCRIKIAVVNASTTEAPHPFL